MEQETGRTTLDMTCLGLTASIADHQFRINMEAVHHACPKQFMSLLAADLFSAVHGQETGTFMFMALDSRGDERLPLCVTAALPMASQKKCKS